MVDVLLFECNNLEGEKKRDERIESFGKTLNNAFKQFQKLFEDYNELLEKCNSSNIQNIARDTNVKCCTCAVSAKENMMPEEEESVHISKERKVNCNPSTPAMNNEPKETFTPENSQCFQIFSQDFCTQGLEESFVNQNKSPLQEIQNTSPKTRAKSPVFGSKKGKTRPPSSIIESPNLSEKSVVILSDFGSVKNLKIDDNRSTSNPAFDFDRTTSSMSAMSPIQISSAAVETAVTPTARNIKKWGISTIQNVNTDIIVGTNKKLKQSKLFVKTEKITDLSTCDDVRANEFDDRDQVTSTNNCLEDSVIQGSPEQEKSLSKIRQKTTRKNKNAQTLQPILNNDGNTAMKPVEVQESGNNDVGQTDTDVTIFDPRIASTQYSDLPCYSKSLRIEKSPFKDKPNLLERIRIREEGGNESHVIDETIFVENHMPSDSQSQKNLNLGKIGKKKKLSLKKIFTTYRDEGVPNDKEISGAEVDISSKEMKTASPPRKKFALANFDVLPRKKNTSPTYAYKGSPVRKQSERALLRGWSCLECQEYYEAIGLSEKDLQKRKNQCSRHRSKFNEKRVSQKDYWNPDFSSSYHSTMWSDD